MSECTRSHAKHRARRAPLRRVPGSLCLAAPADCPLLHHTPYSLSGSITHRICTRWACSWRSFTQAAGCTVKCILQLTAQVEVLTACLPLPTPPLAGHGRRAAPRTLVRNAPATVNAAACGGPCRVRHWTSLWPLHPAPPRSLRNRQRASDRRCSQTTAPVAWGCAAAVELAVRQRQTSDRHFCTRPPALVLFNTIGLENGEAVGRWEGRGVGR